MPKYLIQVSYIGESVRRLLQEERARRREELARIVEHLGGTIETVYFPPGERSAYAFVEMPNANSVMGATMLMRASKPEVNATAVLRLPENVNPATSPLGEGPPGTEDE